MMPGIVLPEYPYGHQKNEDWAYDKRRQQQMENDAEHDALLVNGRRIDYSALPEHMRDGMRLYLERGILPGSFLTAILENDFMEAAKRADEINKHLLFEYASWLYNYAPAGSFGSYDAVKAWRYRR